MKVSGLTVCVYYAKYLEHSLKTWRDTLDQLLVVTAPSDQETIDLCQHHDVPCHQTTVFYADGAFFNKAAALDVGLGILRPDEWVLAFDADIVPPATWRRQVDEASPRPGGLYGVARHEAGGMAIHGFEHPGYFHLFHSSDPNATDRPLFGSWRSAGSYDTEFARRWPRTHWSLFRDFHVTHLGDVGTNWCGLGNGHPLRQMEAERRRLRSYDHERLPMRAAIDRAAGTVDA